MLSSPQVLSAVELGSRAWTRETIDDAGSWYYTLSADCLAALSAFVQRWRRHPRPPTEIRVRDPELAACSERLRPVRSVLAAERGFAVIDRVLRPERW